MSTSSVKKAALAVLLLLLLSMSWRAAFVRNHALPEGLQLAMELQRLATKSDRNTLWQRLQDLFATDTASARSRVESRYRELGSEAECALPLLKELLHNRVAAQTAARCLVQIKPRGVTAVLSLLADGKTTNRTELLLAIAELQPHIDAFSSLYTTLTNGTPAERSLLFLVSVRHTAHDPTLRQELLREGLASPLIEVKCRALELLAEERSVSLSTIADTRQLLLHSNSSVAGLAWRLLQSSNVQILNR